MGSLRYSFIRDSILTCGDLRKVKGWVVRLISGEKTPRDLFEGRL